MFGRSDVFVVNQPPRTEYVTKEVHEYRAPTDKSVELLREMEQAAQDKIVEAIHVGDTTFEAVVHCQKFMEDGSTAFAAVFSLNGKKISVVVRDQDWRTTPQELAAKLRNAVAEKIATEILVPAFKRLEETTFLKDFSK